jgi:hypothetical protein
MQDRKSALWRGKTRQDQARPSKTKQDQARPSKTKQDERERNDEEF